MGRCNGCPACLAVLEFRTSNKKNRKKIKKFEKANPCVNPTANLKRKISEVEQLFAAGHGGEIRGEFRAVPVTAIDGGGTTLRTQKARVRGESVEPTSFNQDAFDEYLDLVLRCTETAKESTSSDVKAEASSMITKMRGLLHPSVKDEVDYAEATKDSSNILTHWMKGEAAGTRAFIPDINYRDQCYAALKIFSCASEEAKKIPFEFAEAFGEDDGIDLYNQLIGMIGEREKQCLPLVNMCLRAWMDRLANDETGNLWADLSPLDFDKWRADAIRKTSKAGHRGKTSYDMMMAIFDDTLPTSDEEHSRVTTDTKCTAKKAPTKVRHLTYPLSTTEFSHEIFLTFK